MTWYLAHDTEATEACTAGTCAENSSGLHSHPEAVDTLHNVHGFVNRLCVNTEGLFTAYVCVASERLTSGY